MLKSYVKFRRRCRPNGKGSLRYFLIALILVFVFAFAEVSGVHSALSREYLEDPHGTARQRIFIAGIHWNSEIILREHWIPALVALTQELGSENIFVSIHGSAAFDDTIGALQLLDTLLEEAGVARRIILDERTHLEQISLPPDVNGWIETPNGTTALRRIPYLARIRNTVMEPLYEMQNIAPAYDRVVFLNDVVFKVGLLLLVGRKGNTEDE